MNIRDLKYIVAVAEYRNFSKASEICFISQPTLSMQIKKLEEYLDIKIFERDNKKVLLTADGSKIIEKAKIILSEVDNIKKFSKSVKSPYAGELIIGVIPTIAPYLLPRIIEKINKQYPNLKIFLKEGTTDNLLKDIKNGKIDVMIQALPMDLGDLKTEVIYKEEFFVAVPKNHEWAERKIIKKNELNDKYILLLEKEHCLRGHILQQLCNLSNNNDKIDFKATSLETLRYMVMSGLGITVIPKLAINESDRNIVYIPFTDPKPYRYITLAWRKNFVREVLVKDLAKKISEILE